MKLVGMRSLWLLVGVLLIGAAWFSGGTRAAELEQPPLAITATEAPTRTATPVPPVTPVAPPSPTSTPDLPPRDTVVPVTLTPEPTRPDGGDGDDPPDPAVVKRVDRTQAQPGDTLVFTLEISNRGESTARQVVVVDSVPDAFEVTGVTAERGEVTRAGQQVTITIPELRPGDVVVVEIQTRVRGDASAAPRENSVTLTSANSDSDLSNNTSIVSVQIDGPTLTPLATATATASPSVTGTPPTATPALTATAAPTPTAVQPVRLPNTAVGGWDATSAALLLLGLIVLGVGVGLRRRA